MTAEEQFIAAAVKTVRIAMRETNTTMADLGRAGIPYMTARRFLKGENTSLRTFARIIEATGCRPALRIKVPLEPEENDGPTVEAGTGI